MPMKYTHLTETERYHIDDMLREGFLQSEIAANLGRSASTLSRELRRNRGKRGWRPKQAQELASERLHQRGVSNVSKVSGVAWEYAKNKLQTEQWSPEQITGRLKSKKKPVISHETIYRRILLDKLTGGSLFTNLRCKKQRKKRYGKLSSGRGCIPNRRDIDERPAVVDNRNRLGDWEGDTVIGCHKGGAVIATMVERKTRYAVVAKSKDKTTASVTSSINRAMAKMDDLVKTITLDNGKEFANHEALSSKLGCDVYFAKPYHSWERGLNENTNGLLRQYFPKKTKFDDISTEEIQAAVNKINNRPRKCLNYKTPAEEFSRLAAKKGIALRI